MRRKALTLSLAAMLAVLTGCSGVAATGSQPKAAPQPDAGAPPGPPPAIEIVAADYGFGVQRRLPGGLVDLALVNRGNEFHFAAFARPVAGKTLEDVRAALTAEGEVDKPPGPPPLVEYAALGTVDSGETSRMTVNLPAGPYVLFCALPAPDGIPHSLKGMMVDVEVTGGTAEELPETQGTVTVADFTIGTLPELTAGTNRVTLENRGHQIHEIDLVQVADGKTIQDAVGWAATFAGAPPIRFLGGPGVRDGLSAVGTFELRPGVRYAFVCIVPDSLGDFLPHLAKGMASRVFEVRP